MDTTSFKNRRRPRRGGLGRREAGRAAEAKRQQTARAGHGARWRVKADQQRCGTTKTVVNFPDGGNDLGQALRETRCALDAGADEIDMVFPWCAFIGGDRDGGPLMVQACKAGCGKRTLIAMLETGELADPLLNSQF